MTAHLTAPELGGRTGPGRLPVVKPTLLGLMILALLSERPMHPYEMQRVMSDRGKDEIINVQRGSLYPAVDRLARAGLIEPAETGREGRRPERTSYRLTAAGQQTGRSWLAGMLHDPRQEYPEFPAAVAFLSLLSPEQVRRQLIGRILLLTREIAALEAGRRLSGERSGRARLFGLEDELRLDLVRAELRWVQSVVDDLETGVLRWTNEPVRPWAAEVQARVRRLPGGSPAGPAA